jgi:hypothetical protein
MPAVNQLPGALIGVTMLTDFEHYVDDRGELSLNAKQLREDDPKRYAQIFLDSLAYYSGWPKHLVREGPGHIDPGMHSTSRKSHIRSILFMSDRSDNSGDVLVVDQACRFTTQGSHDINHVVYYLPFGHTEGQYLRECGGQCTDHDELRLALQAFLYDKYDQWGGHSAFDLHALQRQPGHEVNRLTYIFDPWTY